MKTPREAYLATARGSQPTTDYLPVFLAAGFFDAGFFAADFLAAGFFDAGFFAADFLAAGFLEVAILRAPTRYAQYYANHSIPYLGK